MAAQADSAMVTVRYWAGAREAAGVDSDRVSPSSLHVITAALTTLHPGLGRVLDACTILVDGAASQPQDEVPPGATVEVLPPFAGG